MFLFLKLYLAHLLADFLLQFDELYQLKVKSIAGHILHALMHAVLSAVLVFPYLGDPFIWIFIFLISVLHMLQDYWKYHWRGPKKYGFPIFLADQLFHLLWISLIVCFPIASRKTSLPEFWWGDLYLNHSLTVVLTAWILATVAGSYTLHSFSASYSPRHRKNRFITKPELMFGALERTLILIIFLFSPSPIFWLSSPFVGLLRIIVPRFQNRREFLASFLYATIVGLIFRNLF